MNTIQRPTRHLLRLIVALALACALSLAVAQNGDQDSDSSAQGSAVTDLTTLRQDLMEIQDALESVIDRLDIVQATDASSGASATAMEARVAALESQLRRNATGAARRALAQTPEITTRDDLVAAREDAERLQRDLEAAYSAGRISAAEAPSGAQDELTAYIQALRDLEADVAEGELTDEQRQRISESRRAVVDALDTELDAIDSELATIERAPQDARTLAIENEITRLTLEGARLALVRTEEVATGEEAATAADDVIGVRRDLQTAYLIGRSELPATLGDPVDAYVQALQAIEPGELDEAARTDLTERRRAVLDAIDVELAEGEGEQGRLVAELRLTGLEPEIDRDPAAAADVVAEIRSDLAALRGDDPSELELELDTTLGRLTEQLREGRAEAYEDTYGRAVRMIRDMRTGEGNGGS